MTVLIDRQSPVMDQQRDEANRLYHDIFVWPTTIDDTTGDIRLRLGTVVDALIMRAGFAAEVNDFLVRHMFRAPIIVASGSPADWIFLTLPRTTMRRSVWEDLVRIQVGWKRRDETILLPAVHNTDGVVRWLTPPQQRVDLPPLTAVVAAARKASAACGTW